jgi:Cu+-exporting ATPase
MFNGAVVLVGGRQRQPDDAPGSDGPARETRVADPVCGMRVDPATAPEHRGTGNDVVYFCSAGRAASFDASPHRAAAAAQN